MALIFALGLEFVKNYYIYLSYTEQLKALEKTINNKPVDPSEFEDRKSTRLNSSHIQKSRMPSSA